jgi:hypothetical protein
VSSFSRTTPSSFAVGDASMVMLPGAQRGNHLCGGVAREASTAPQQMLGRLIAL